MADWSGSGQLTANTPEVDGASYASANAVGHWKLDSTSGLVAYDSVNGYNGDLTNMVGDEWTPGIIKGALDFDGIDDFVKVGGDDTWKSLTEGTINLWFRVTDLSSTKHMFGVGPKTETVTGKFLFFQVRNGGFIRVHQRNNTSDSVGFDTDNGSIVVNTWYMATYSVSDSGNKIYIDGQQVTPTYFNGNSSTSVFFNDILTTTQNYWIASAKYNGLIGSYFPGIIDDVRIYDEALTNDEVYALYVQGGQLAANASEIDGSAISATGVAGSGQLTTETSSIDGAGYTPVNGSGELTSEISEVSGIGYAYKNLIGHFKFDESSGDIASDSSPIGNDADLINMTGDQWVEGRFGNALHVQATGSKYIKIPYTPIYNTPNITINLWFKTTGNSMTILRRYGGAGDRVWIFTMAPYGLQFSVYNNLDQGATSVDQYRWDIGGSWTMLTCVVDGLSVKTYTNGRPSPSIGTLLSPMNTSSSQYIESYGGTVYYCTGDMDELSIYNEALSNSEILELYKYNNLQAHYRFDETSGLVAVDSSNNAINGSLINMDGNEWTTGEINGALSFNGSTDYVQIGGDDTYKDFKIGSISLWVNMDSFSADAVIFCAGPKTESTSGKYLYIRITTTGTILIRQRNEDSDTNHLVAETSSSVITSTGTWYHIVYTVGYDGTKLYVDNSQKTLTYTTGSSSTRLFFNDIDTIQNYWVAAAKQNGTFNSYLDGILDDVRIYDRDLTSQEVTDLYNYKALKTYYNLDETSDLVAYDSSTYLEDGTLVNMTGEEWVKQGINGALRFDGVDDYVIMAEAEAYKSLTEGTISLWFKANDLLGSQGLFCAINTYLTNRGPAIQLFLAGSTIYFRLRAYQNDVILTLYFNGAKSADTWYHVAFTVGPTGQKMYLNGQEASVTYTLGDSSNNMFFADIGGLQNYFLGSLYYDGLMTNFFNGTIDEFRIHDRVLSAQEISDIYNEVRFSDGSLDPNNIEITASAFSVSDNEGDGELEANLADIDGDAGIINDGNGELTGNLSEIDGDGLAVIDAEGDGELVVNISNIDGDAGIINDGNGELEANLSEISGSAESIIDVSGSGELTCNESEIPGQAWATIDIDGSGILVTEEAFENGIGFGFVSGDMVGFGNLTVNNAEMQDGEGSAIIDVDGDGDLEANDFESYGTAFAIIDADGDGEIDFNISEIEGDALTTINALGSGFLSTIDAEIDGEGNSSSDVYGDGELSFNNAEIDGDAWSIIDVEGSGILITEEAFENGIGFGYVFTNIVGFGDLATNSVEMSGNGDATRDVDGDGELSANKAEIDAIATVPTLLVHLRLNETSGQIAYDAQGFENGILGTSFTDDKWVPGKFGNALSMPGFSYGLQNKITIPFNQHYNVNNFTVYLWFKTGSAGRTIICRNWLGGDRVFAIGTENNGRMTMAVWDENLVTAAWVDSTITAINNEWHPVAITVSGDTVKFFFDAELRHTDYLSSGGVNLSSDQEILVGQTYSASTRYGGLVDDIRFYNYALEDNDVIALMNSAEGYLIAQSSEIDGIGLSSKYTTEALLIAEQSEVDGTGSTSRNGTGELTPNNAEFNGVGEGQLVFGEGDISFNNLEIVVDAWREGNAPGAGDLEAQKFLVEGIGSTAHPSIPSEIDFGNAEIASNGNFATHPTVAPYILTPNSKAEMAGDGYVVKDAYYTIGTSTPVTVTTDTVTQLNQNLWEITFTGAPNLSSVNIHDKYTDGASKAWSVESVDNTSKKVTVSNQERHLYPIVPGSTIGPWYGSWTAFVAGEAEDLVVATVSKHAEFADDWASGYNEEGTSNMSVKSSDGWVSNSLYNLEIKAVDADRHDGKVTGDGFFIKSTYTGSGAVLSVDDVDYVTINGIKMDMSATTSNSVEGITINASGGADEGVIKKCLVYSGSSKDMSNGALIRAVSSAGTGSNFYIHDNFVIGNSTVKRGIYAYGYDLTTQTRAGRIYNNTVGKCSTNIYSQVAGSSSYVHEITNNYCFDADINDYEFSGLCSNSDPEFNFNVSSDATAGSVNDNVSSIGATTGGDIEDTTDDQEDLHIQFTSVLRAIGIGPLADSNVSTTDIDNTARVSTIASIGADDILSLIVASGSGLFNVNNAVFNGTALTSKAQVGSDVLTAQNAVMQQAEIGRRINVGSGELIASDATIWGQDGDVLLANKAVFSGSGSILVYTTSGQLNARKAVIRGLGPSSLNCKKSRLSGRGLKGPSCISANLVANQAQIAGTNLTVFGPIYSVGEGTGDLKIGSPTMTIQNSAAIFSDPQTHTNMVAGDEVIYGIHKCYLSRKISDTKWAIVDNQGRFVSNEFIPQTIGSIKHVFTTLDDAFNLTTGVTSSSYMNSTDLTETTGIDSDLSIVCANDIGSSYDPEPVQITGITTDSEHVIKVFAPRDTDGSEIGDNCANRNHQTTGIPGTGYILNINGSLVKAIEAIDVDIIVKGIEVKGSCDWGVYIGQSSRTSRDWNVAVINCIIYNSGTYGILFSEGSYVINNASSLNNIIFGQDDHGIYFKSDNAFSFNNTIYGITNTLGTGAGINIISGTNLDMGNTTIFGCDNDLRGVKPRSIIHCCGDDNDFNPDNGTAADWDGPYTGMNNLQRTNFIITQTADNYADFVVNAAENSTANFTITNRNSELFLSGSWDSSSGINVDKIPEYDMAGTKRFKPFVSIGALELAIVLEFSSGSIKDLFQDKLIFDPSIYDEGYYYSYKNSQILYRRPASAFNNDAAREEFARESKILMAIKDGRETYSLKSDKTHPLIMSVEAYYDMKQSTIIFNKLNTFDAGLLYNLISDTKYKFYFDEQNSLLNVYLPELNNYGLSGNKNIVNSVKMGGSNMLNF